MKKKKRVIMRLSNNDTITSRRPITETMISKLIAPEDASQQKTARKVRIAPISGRRPAVTIQFEPKDNATQIVEIQLPKTKSYADDLNRKLYALKTTAQLVKGVRREALMLSLAEGLDITSGK